VVRQQRRGSGWLLHVDLQELAHRHRSRCATPARARKARSGHRFKLEARTSSPSTRPHFKFTEVISLYINCETQEKSSGSGASSLRREEHDCGWLKDRYGFRGR